MSMSVGAVSLDLEIQNTIVKQLRAAAKSGEQAAGSAFCLLYTSPSPRD